VRLSPARRQKEHLAVRALERDPEPVGGVVRPRDLPGRLRARQHFAAGGPVGRDLPQAAPVLGPGHVQDGATIRPPGGVVRVRRESAGVAAERWREPQVAAEHPVLQAERLANADEPAPRGACRDERDRAAIGGERRLDVLRGVVRDIDLLPAVDAADVHVEVARADPLQLHAHVAGALPAVVGVLGQAVLHEPLEGRRRERRQLAHGPGLVLQDRPDEARLARALEGPPARHHLVQHRPQREDVLSASVSPSTHSSTR
jgi:hypothetical protein